MLYCRHESLFTRFTAASRASGRCRTEPGRDCQDVCGLGGDDQTLSQTTTRDRSRFAKSDPRPSCADQCGVAGPLESAVRSPDRKSTRLNSSHVRISYAVFCLKKKNRPYAPPSSIALTMMVKPIISAK